MNVEEVVDLVLLVSLALTATNDCLDLVKQDSGQVFDGRLGKGVVGRYLPHWSGAAVMNRTRMEAD